MAVRINVDRGALERFCTRHRICKLSFFGSVLRDDFDPDRSDIDVLVEFKSGFVPSLFKLSRMRFELEEVLGRHVHICRPADLSQYFRDTVLQDAEVQYVAA